MRGARDKAVAIGAAWRPCCPCRGVLWQTRGAALRTTPPSSACRPPCGPRVRRRPTGSGAPWRASARLERGPRPGRGGLERPPRRTRSAPGAPGIPRRGHGQARAAGPVRVPAPSLGLGHGHKEQSEGARLMTPLSTRAVTDQALSHPAALGGPCAALGSTAGALGPPDGLLGHAGPQGYARAPMGAVGGWAGRWQRVTTLRCAARCAQRPPLVACRRPLGAPGAPNQLQRFGAQGRGARRGLGTPLGHPSPARPVGATSQGGADATAAPVPHGPGRGRTRAWQVGTPNDADGPRGWSCGRGVGTGLLAPNVAGSRLKKGLPGLPRARAEVPSPGPASPLTPRGTFHHRSHKLLGSSVPSWRRASAHA